MMAVPRGWRRLPSRGQRVLSYAVRYSNNGSTRPQVNYAATALTPNQTGGLSFEAVYVSPARSEIHSTINLRVPGRHKVQMRWQPLRWLTR
jgi:hypothetical protein